MKLIAFECREDELAAFEKYAALLDVQIECRAECLLPENIDETGGYDAVSMLGRSCMNSAMMEGLAARGVRFVCGRTVGYDHVDVAAARRCGIRVSHSSYSPEGVSDFTLMLMLMSLRKYKQALFRGNVNDYSLEGLRGRQMQSMTIGVVGGGRIGRAVIRKLGGFGPRVLVYDPHPSAELRATAECVGLETLFVQSDIITLHTPLTDATRHMIDRQALAMMKHGVIVINTARGELIDTQAMIEALEDGKIGALGLDVIEQEEGVYHRDRRTDIIKNRNMAYVRQFPNVIMTPHCAFYTDEAVEEMVGGAVQAAVDFARKGETPLEVRG